MSYIPSNQEQRHDQRYEDHAGGVAPPPEPPQRPELSMIIDTSDSTAFVQSVQGNPDIFLDWYHKLDAFAGSQASHTENVTQQLHHYKSQYELLQSEYNSTSKNFERATYITEELRSQLAVKEQQVINLQIDAAQGGHPVTTPIPTIKLSEKVPDAALFDGTPEKLPGWLADVRMKLIQNQDRFPISQSRVVHAFSRLGDGPKK